MLAIRLQRTGRKGHAMFRVVVQDAHRTPTSGKLVALLGSYDPHAKTVVIDKEKAAGFLKNGARPTDRVIRLLESEGVKLPKWAISSTPKSGNVRNPDKLRKNRPAEPVAEAPAEAPAAEVAESASAEAEAPKSE